MKKVKKIILSQIENQFGELIPELVLIIDVANGAIAVEYINCYNSKELGLGTCQCRNHNALEREERSLQYAENLLKEAFSFSEISKEEYLDGIQALQMAAIVAKEKEKEREEKFRRDPLALLFHSFDMKEKEELEQAILACYKLGINPLSRIRKVLKPYGWKVIYHGVDWRESCTVNPAPKTILCGVVYKEDVPVDVFLDVGDYSDE